MTNPCPHHPTVDPSVGPTELGVIYTIRTLEPINHNGKCPVCLERHAEWLAGERKYFKGQMESYQKSQREIIKEHIFEYDEHDKQLATAKADTERLAFYQRVMDAVAFDNCEMIWWRTDTEYAPITFFVNCNDLFWWATSDAETVTPENIHLLEESIKDVEAVDDISELAGDLFCCRSRKMRPQGAAYSKDKRFWPLFDACGPDRDIDKGPFGNPKKHPR